MSRWAADAHGRLQRAAVELFLEQGFAATTVPQIAQRAGLTTRTFFRHFADKREVLFDGDAIPSSAAAFIREAPRGIEPFVLIRNGLRSVARDSCDGHRDEWRTVRSIIGTEPALQERDLKKRADLAAAIRNGFSDRGEDATTAALAADLAVSVLHAAVDRWLETPEERPMSDVLDEVLDASAALVH